MTISSWKDKALFTPGPLTTGRAVKQAMLRDWERRFPGRSDNLLRALAQP